MHNSIFVQSECKQTATNVTFQFDIQPDKSLLFIFSNLYLKILFQDFEMGIFKPVDLNFATFRSQREVKNAKILREVQLKIKYRWHLL